MTTTPAEARVLADAAAAARPPHPGQYVKAATVGEAFDFGDWWGFAWGTNGDLFTDTPPILVSKADGTISFDPLPDWPNNAPVEDPMTVTAATAAPEVDTDLPTQFPFHGVATPEGLRTGDGRSFSEEALTWADLPVPFRVQNEDQPGHDGSVRVGRIDSIWRDSSGDFPKIRYTGAWAVDSLGQLTEAAAAARDEVRGGFLRGVSVDLDSVTVEFLDSETGLPKAVEEGGEDDFFDFLFGDPGLMNVTAGRIRSMAGCSIPAFQEAYIADGVYDPDAIEGEPGDGQEVPIVTDEAASDEERETLAVKPAPPIGQPMRGMMPDGETECSCDEADADYDPACVCGEEAAARPVLFNLVSSAAPVYAVADFTDPGFSEGDGRMVQAPDGTWGCPLTVTDDGRIYGHLAKWGTCHIGFDGACVTPPASEAAYAYFATGSIATDAGEVPVGQITLGTGHAAATLGARPAVEHYDNTGTAVADVAAGEDEYGIWYAGRLRPTATDDDVLALRHGGAVSGDWRRLGGSLELVAALAVNTPGFPVPRRALAASAGVQTSLVAAGLVAPAPTDEDHLDAERVARRVLSMLDRRVRVARLARRVGRDPASRVAAAARTVHPEEV